MNTENSISKYGHLILKNLCFQVGKIYFLSDHLLGWVSVYGNYGLWQI